MADKYRASSGGFDVMKYLKSGSFKSTESADQFAMPELSYPTVNPDAGPAPVKAQPAPAAPAAPAPVSAPPVYTEADLLKMGKIAPKGEGVDSAFQPPDTLKASDRTAEPGQGIYQDAEGVYRNNVAPLTPEQAAEKARWATVKADSPENIAIIQKNAADATAAWDTYNRNELLRNATDSWQRALNSATPGTRGYKSKLKMASETLNTIRGMIGDTQTAETARMNAEETRKYREGVLEGKPELVTTDKGIFSFNPRTGVIKDTGMKPNPKEYGPEHQSAILKSLSDLAKPYTDAGKPVPPDIQEVIDQTLKNIRGTTGSTEGQTAKYADGTKLKGPEGKTYIVKNGVPVAL